MFDVIIIGSGPAGISTALHLNQHDPDWSERILILEKSVHPREKPCGGGISRFGEEGLNALGLSIDVPFFPIRELRFCFESHIYALRADPILRIVNRSEFDHWLVRVAERAGISIHQGDAVVNIEPHTDFIKVMTGARTYYAKTIVAADGATSLVRRKLHCHANVHAARLLEILTPENPETTGEFQEHTAIFDFSPMLSGLQGYYWDIPVLMNQQALMNRGIYDSRIRKERPRAALKSLFEKQLEKHHHDMSAAQLKSHPITLYDRHTTLSKNRVLFVGDAAGTDPLFGEGIPFALAYGEVAAEEIVEAFNTQQFHFRDYKTRISHHRLLNQLPSRALAARFLYKLPQFPWILRPLSAAAPIIFRLLAVMQPRYIPMTDPHMDRIT